MTKLEKIEQQVEALTSDELAHFRVWFAEFDAAQWDDKIERDVVAGRLDSLAKKALAAHSAGASRKL